MGRIAKCVCISRSLYHTAVAKPWPQSFRTEFQRFSQRIGSIKKVNENLKNYGLFLFITWICTLAAGVAQQAFGSVEKPVVYSFAPKGPSDGLLHRGAYGLYFAGIFISLYGVYLMMNDKTKKCSH